MLDWRFVIFFKRVVQANPSLLNVHFFVVAHLCVLTVKLFNEFLFNIDLFVFNLFIAFLHRESEVYLALQATHLVVECLLAINAVMWVKLIEGIRE